MTLKNENIQLDGTISGIIVQVNNDGKVHYISSKNGCARLFNNLEIAKFMANSITGGEKVALYIRTKELGDINISRCRYIKKTREFQFIDLDNYTVYNIKEKRTHNLDNLAYLIFDNGDTVRISKEIGPQRQRELIENIRYVCSIILGQKKGITLVEKKRKELIIHISGTTTKVHIMYNSKVMDINQYKSQIPGVKRIPFLKEMDKFTTFYILSSKDVNESKQIEGEAKAAEVISIIIEYLKEYYPYTNPKVCNINYHSPYLEMED